MNVKKRIKYICTIIVLAVSFVFGYLFNRKGVSGSNDSVEQLGAGIDSARENNKRIKKSTADIRKNNIRARTELRTAKDILRTARERAGKG